MKELERLVLLVEKYSNKHLNKHNDFSPDSMEYRLYQLVKQKQVTDDSAAVKALYGESGEAKGYKMLKSRLKKRLYSAVDSVILTETSLKPYVHDEQKSLNLLNRAFTLFQLGEYKLALKVILQAEEIASELKITSVLLRSQELKYIILYGLDDFTAFKACEKELLYYKGINNLEIESLVIHRNARFGIKQVVSGREAHLRQLPEAILNLKKNWEDSKSPLIFEYLQTLQIQYYELTGDFEKIIEVADSANQLTLEGIIPEKRIDLRFNKFIKLYSLLQLRRYEEGLAYAQTLENTFLKGSQNWAAYLENYFLLALQSENYKLALDILADFSASGVTAHLVHAAKERWALYIAFFNLMAGEDLCHKNLLGKEIKSLLKLSVKDKEGFNVAILILDLFNTLKEGHPEDISFIYDLIRKYVSKHLNKKEAERPRLFLRLMLLMLREDLDVKACKTKGRYLLQKLKKAPVPGNAFAEVEIVPYEQLWEHALQLVSGIKRPVPAT